MSEPDVLIERRGHALHIRLNRPKALNALSLPMIRLIDPPLAAAAADPSVKLVVLSAAGDRAFCAGGDVRALALSLREPGQTLSQDFFREEYVLNRRIHRFPKPFVSLVDGLSMGGGVGLSVHGSHRVVSERLVFAMPETGIGLFPDVGGTWFLPRCPGGTGMYLALTGARLHAADALHVGYATHFVPSVAMTALREALFATTDVEATIAAHAGDPGTPSLAAHRAVIDRCFDQASVEAVLSALAAEQDDFAAASLDGLRGKSPTSMKITFRALREGRDRAVEDCLVTEYRMSQHCMAGHDFAEGIRALLIDKDMKPAWRPGRLEEVGDTLVEAHFMPLGARDLRFD